MNWLAIALGGALGSVLRYAVYRGSLQYSSAHPLAGGFPYGTFAVNVLGAFAIGVLWAWQAQGHPEGQSAWSAEARAFLFTGLLGGFTTFSTFSLEGAQLIKGGAPGMAALYLLGSLALGLVAALAGMGLGRHLA